MLTRTLAILVLCAAAVGCAKPRHVATVTVLSSHAVIAETQDTADRVTCGAATAPSPCLPEDVRHGVISDYLKGALKEDIAMLTAVRNWPGPPTSLADVGPYLATITDLVSKVVNALPESAQKQRLLKLIGGAR